MAGSIEYRGWTIEWNRYGVFAYTDGNDFAAADVSEAKTRIDRIHWDAEQDAAFDALHSLDAALATTDAQIKEMV